MNSTALKSVAPSLPVSDKAAHVEPSWLSPAGRGAHLSLAADSDPFTDELLHRVRNPRSNLTVCPECGNAFAGPHQCRPKATVFSTAGEEALRRSDAAVERIERDREQQRRDEIDAAWAEYNDQPAVEVKQYLSAAA